MSSDAGSAEAGSDRGAASADLRLDLRFAQRMADLADGISLRHFAAGGLVARVKRDDSPVTDADEEIERALRTLIRRERAGEAFLGEEFGACGDGERRWIVDPVDGTASFLAGEPEWSTLIGLVDRDEGSAEPGSAGLALAGLVSAPACGRRWWAARGHGAWTSALPMTGDAPPPQRLSLAGAERLSDATVGIWPPPGRLSPRHAAVAARLADAAARTVPGGLDWTGPPPAARVPKPSTGTGTCHGALLVAANRLDAFLLLGAGAWDVAALVPIVEEAGGVVSDLRGTRRLDSGAALFAASRALSRQILDLVHQDV